MMTASKQRSKPQMHEPHPACLRAQIARRNTEDAALDQAIAENLQRANL